MVAPPTVNMLAEALGHLSHHLDRALPVGERARAFWAISRAVHDLGASDVVAHDLTNFARATGLTDDLGASGNADVAHLIRWALLDQNPFRRKTGPRP